MKSIIIALMLMCITMLSAALNDNQSNEMIKSFAITNQTSNHLNMKFKLPEVEIKNIETSGHTWQKVIVDNANYTVDEGMPEFPIFSTTIAIPNVGSVSVSGNSTRERNVTNFMPYPVQIQSDGNSPKSFTYNQDFYNGNSIYPISNIKYSDPQIIRDFRIITIQVNPFRWNSDTQQLTILDEIEINLNFISEQGINEMPAYTHYSKSFENIYESLILNFEYYRALMVANIPPKYVIIHGATTNQSFLTKLNDFAYWKRQKGADVRIASTSVTGLTNTQIKSYLQTLYNDTGSRPDFIILVGDTSGSFPIPSWTESWSTYGGKGDYPYTQLAGSDLLGDCFIGRISVESVDQFDIILAKIYAYEKNLNVNNAAWLNRMLIVSDTAHDGISVVYIANYLKELALDANPNYTFDFYAMSGPSPDAMNTSINTGVGLFNYRGYLGMSSWSPSESLTNGVKLPHAVIITCGTGNYDGGTATTEAFIRLGTAASPKGAVTAIGMYTSGTHTMFNNCLDGGILAGIYTYHMRSMGEALLHGKLYIEQIYGASHADKAHYFAHWCNLMGDPTMEVYTGIPQTFSIDAPASIPNGVTVVDMNVVDNTGAPIAEACVTISQNNQILSRNYTDATGYVSLSLSSSAVSGNATITVSKHNFKPLQQLLVIDAAGSLVPQQLIVDDDNFGGTHGNNNLIANSGETIELMFSLTNTTSNPITGVTGFLTSTSPYVTIIDANVAYPDFLAGEVQNSTNTAIINISSACPNNTMLRFNLHLTDSQNHNYIVSEYLPVYGPHYLFGSYQIIDGQNQVLNPGEQASINLNLMNNGVDAAQDLYGRLYSDNYLIDVQDNLGYFGSIQPGTQGSCSTNPFLIHCDGSTLQGMVIPMRVNLFNELGYSQDVFFSITIGNVNVHDPLGPDSYGYVIYDSQDTSYPECPVYSWIPIAPAEGGQGTAIAITDNGVSSDEGDQIGSDALEVLTLPFTFRFYGLPYNQITVCANGFIVMGVTQNGEFRNYRLPGAMGPSPMIAPFWDDLRTTGGGIYQWYDSTNNQFIIEWYNCKNGYNGTSVETFQVILYNPENYPTSTGDGPIKYQYKVFNNVDSSSGTNEGHGNYCTIGIENHDQTVGLEYSYNNQYPVTAASLTNERALYITTAPRIVQDTYLVLGNTVCEDANGNAVVEPGEMVNLGLELNNIGIATAQNIVATISSTDPSIAILTNSATYRDLEANTAGFNQTPFVFNVSETSTTHTATFIVNITSGALSWQRSFTLEIIKAATMFNSSTISDFAGNNNGVVDPGETVKLIISVQNLSNIAITNTVGMLSSTSEDVTINNPIVSIAQIPGNKIMQYIYEIQISQSSPSNPQIVYNFNFSSHNSNGFEQNFTPSISPYGLIYGNVNLTSNQPATNALVYSDNGYTTIPGTTGDYELYLPYGVYTITSIAEYHHSSISSNVVLSSTTQTQLRDFMLVYLPSPDNFRYSGNNSTQTVTLMWNAPLESLYPVLGYKVWRKDNAGPYRLVTQINDLSYAETITTIGHYLYYVNAVYQGMDGAPTNVLDVEYPFTACNDNQIPQFVNKLGSNYPNPFNPSTTISYCLAKTGNVKLSIFNIKGQLVTRLKDSVQTAGNHSVVWNGKDSGNRAVSSGIYYYRIETEGYSKTKKMMLLK